jgi:hypothetical protein
MSSTQPPLNVLFLICRRVDSVTGQVDSEYDAESRRHTGHAVGHAGTVKCHLPSVDTDSYLDSS